MTPFLQATRDVIIRTDAWQDAVTFYESVLGLPIVHRSADLIGFEAGAFRLYVEKGRHHGPVFELLVPDVESTKQQLLAAGCVLQEEDASVPRCYLRDPVGLVFNLRRADSAT
jgi:catechol 2,3-dioxygenase-like lactoylglutathione lyase family enzyme